MSFTCLRCSYIHNNYKHAYINACHYCANDGGNIRCNHWNWIRCKVEGIVGRPTTRDHMWNVWSRWGDARWKLHPTKSHPWKDIICQQCKWSQNIAHIRRRIEKWAAPRRRIQFGNGLNYFLFLQFCNLLAYTIVYREKLCTYPCTKNKLLPKHLYFNSKLNPT